MDLTQIDPADTKDAIRSFISTNLVFDDRTVIGDDDSLLERGLIDSTGVLELVTFLEGRYDLTFDDQELVADNFDSINRIATFIAKKTA